MIRTRCTDGHLILSDRFLSIEGPRVNLTMRIEDVTSVNLYTQVPSLFGRGGGVRLTVVAKNGATLIAQMVPPREAQAIRASLLGST